MNFLNCALQALPVSNASNIVKRLLEYTKNDNHTLQKNIYFVIETVFAATRLSSSFVEDFLNYLLDNVPLYTEGKTKKND